jgi:hypothetical protein
MCLAVNRKTLTYIESKSIRLSDKFFTRFDFASHQPEFYHSSYKGIRSIRKRLGSLATLLPNPIAIPVNKLLEESIDNVSMTGSSSNDGQEGESIRKNSDSFVSYYNISSSSDKSSRECLENIVEYTAKEESGEKGNSIQHKY